MSQSPARDVSDMPGDAAPPRKNGEPVFDEPWEGRAFGLAVALNEAGAYAWRDFHGALVEETAADERRGRRPAYYRRWLRALERLAVARALVTPAELDARAAALGADADHGGH